MASPERIGLLGGTFDPIHRGHVDAALAARQHLGLDRVLLIPSHVPPHRPLQPQASAFHRFAMAALAAGAHDGLEASDIELLDDGPSYTARTLERLRASGLVPWQLFFIIGTDAFADIATWYDYPAVLDAAHFVVVSRPGHRHDEVLRRAPELAGRVLDLRGPPRGPATIPAHPAVIFIAAPTADVSSTSLRRRLAAGQDISDLVPAAVARHILLHHLYQAARDGSPLA
ncbi:MAG: nicotinate-nucleotide adenylyltransferase [Vicinamibacterales bacterium]|jgi:nicotinate-nucleotide adenylyltransferase|nr:nicotinate-nucleotide adenylyltransferase [Vicinamibacterales bacterium]